ncbi:chromosome transmission fidelity protein 8 [Mycena sanguinolenta]|nr:chromosome transmission fidelity protein 8 [Mycena sanguinolenta]
MIIPIDFPVASASTPKLPPTLATISHGEVVLIELQGAFEVECTNDRERDGKLVGRLSIDDAAKRPTLMVGYHLLEGKVTQLAKPLAVLRRVAGRVASDLDDEMDCDDDGAGKSQAGATETSTVSWDAIAVVKRKIVFSKRPMPIVGRST